jgi:peroxiredoxin
VVVCFLAPLSTRGTLANLEALTEIWPRIDAEAGGLVALTRSPVEAARDFVPRYHVLFPVLVDETGEDFARWGVPEATGFAVKLRGARPGFLKRAVSILRNGQPLPEANEAQLPAVFVVEPDGTVLYRWTGTRVDDVIDAQAVLAAACS